MDKIVVTKKQAKNNFMMIGFIFIVYCILCVMVPVGINFLNDYFSLVKPFAGLTLDTSLLYIKFFFIIIGSLLTIASLVLINRTINDKKKNHDYHHLFGYVLNYFVLISFIAFILSAILQFFPNFSFSLTPVIGIDYDSNRLFDIVYALVYFIVLPVIEEVIFRGILFKNLSKFSYNCAIYVTAGLFAIAHGNIVEIVISFIAGLYLAGARKKTNSVFSTILIRLVYNVLIYLLTITPSSLQIYASSIVAVVYIGMIIYDVLSVFKNSPNKFNENDYKILDLYLSCPTNIISIFLMAITCIVNLFV